jgi:hypothetical protein
MWVPAAAAMGGTLHVSFWLGVRDACRFATMMLSLLTNALEIATC